MVPVLPRRETMDLWACAAEVTRLAEARAPAKAAREALSGSTITITSLGALGGIVSTPGHQPAEVAMVRAGRCEPPGGAPDGAGLAPWWCAIN